MGMNESESVLLSVQSLASWSQQFQKKITQKCMHQIQPPSDEFSALLFLPLFSIVRMHLWFLNISTIMQRFYTQSFYVHRSAHDFFVCLFFCSGFKALVIHCTLWLALCVKMSETGKSINHIKKAFSNWIFQIQYIWELCSKDRQIISIAGLQSKRGEHVDYIYQAFSNKYLYFFFVQVEMDVLRHSQSVQLNGIRCNISSHGTWEELMLVEQ